MKVRSMLLICAVFLSGCSTTPAILSSGLGPDEDSGVSASSAKPSELTDRIDKVVRKYFPDAVVSRENNGIHAKHGTMVFTIHRHWKTGEILKETNQVEGPNYLGFMISVSTEDGPYQGQAMIPQILNRRYWQEYIDRPPTEDGKGHFVIDFSFGLRLNRVFTKEIFEILPKSRPTATPSMATE